ncbi:MAG: hypothetical protein PHX21_01340 [bacterium]|nr:hypothetical protein [bacterium]
MKTKIPLIFFAIILLTPSFAQGVESYFHVCPLSLDKGTSSFTSMDFMELGFGAGPVVLGTEFIGYKVVPGGHQYNIEMFPLKAYLILSDTKRMKLYGYLNYSPFGEGGSGYEYELERGDISGSSSVHSLSLGIGATFYHSMRLCLGYYNSEGPYNLRSGNVYASLGVGLPDFYGKWNPVKGEKSALARIGLPTLGGALASPLIGFAGTLVFGVIKGTGKTGIYYDPDAILIALLGVPVGAVIGLASGIYWSTCK